MMGLFAVKDGDKGTRTTPRLLVHFLRFQAEVRLMARKEPIPSRVFLVDISQHGAGIFAAKKIKPGKRISLCIFTDLNRFSVVNGKVMWCKQYGSGSRILGDKSFPYRLGIEFEFGSDEGKRVIKDFLKSAAALIP